MTRLHKWFGESVSNVCGCVDLCDLHEIAVNAFFDEVVANAEVFNVSVLNTVVGAMNG